MRSRTITTWILFLGAMLLAVASAVHAEPPPSPSPGTVVSYRNLDKYESFLSPAMQWVVDRGFEMRVIAPREIAHPPAVLAATAKYAEGTELAPDASHLVNHVAGLPFPGVSTADPMLATKLMFNFNSAINHDDSDIRNFHCDTGSVGDDGDSMIVERHFLIDHIRRLYFVGRTEVEPFPSRPNRDRVRFKEALYPVIEPFDLKGVGFTMNRYLDHKRQDDTWLYLPQLRRVRRLSSAQRSDALFGQDTDQDSYEGYQGNIAWMDWRYLGETTILASMHSENMPVKWAPASAEFMHDDVWEPRKVWIIAGSSRLPQYAYSRRIIYLDQEIHRIPYTEMYDRAGELWKMWVNNYRFAPQAIPGATQTFDFDVAYRPSISMIDIQLEHATACAMPSPEFPGEQGWYINAGDSEGTTENFFDLSTLLSSGR